MAAAYYLDATDTATGVRCQVEIDQASRDREARRDIFTVTDAPRDGWAIKARYPITWTPTRRSAAA